MAATPSWSMSTAFAQWPQARTGRSSRSSSMRTRAAVGRDVQAAVPPRAGARLRWLPGDSPAARVTTAGSDVPSACRDSVLRSVWISPNPVRQLRVEWGRTVGGCFERCQRKGNKNGKIMLLNETFFDQLSQFSCLPPSSEGSRPLKHDFSRNRWRLESQAPNQGSPQCRGILAEVASQLLAPDACKQSIIFGCSDEPCPVQGGSSSRASADRFPARSPSSRLAATHKETFGLVFLRKR